MAIGEAVRLDHGAETGARGRSAQAAAGVQSEFRSGGIGFRSGHPLVVAFSRRTGSHFAGKCSRGEPTLTIRTRKLIGTIVLFVLLACWVMLGLALAPVAFSANSDLAGAVFYVVAGLGWLVIAMPLVKWMSRPDPAP